MDHERASGILLHPTSLPGGLGIGDLGPAAYRWIDWLVSARQRLWQVLPLGPTGFADSPYACLSAFAGNPLLISLDKLIEDGYITADDLAPTSEDDLEKMDYAVTTQMVGHDPERIDYGRIIQHKMPLLRRAARRFLTHANATQRSQYERFIIEQSWLADFALFMAVKEQFAQIVWYEWPGDIALRRPEAMAHWRQELASDIEAHQVLQFFFFQQWQQLKSYANARRIRIVGDVPIFVAADSADVWANPHLFHLDQDGRPTLISGVPPDYFSATGQRWGNPLYRWEVMAQDGYKWWIERIRTVLNMVDMVRIDHFRGLVAYWEIPASEPTAIKGQWQPGPGAALFEAIEGALGRLPIWAEDLGVITPEVIDLRERFGLPGMKILQFAFDEAALRASFGRYTRNPFLPHNYTENFVVYTGTHDNDTALGWFEHCPPAERRQAMAYLGCDEREFNWSLIRAAMASVAQTAMFPLQDVLGLSGNARMNLPGTTGSNWTWRCRADALTEQLAGRLAQMTTLYER